MQLPVLKVPDYGDLREFGPWRLDKIEPMNPKNNTVLQRGYWSGLDWEPCYHRLTNTEDGEVWMVSSRMERESLAIHLKHAKGTVVVCGIGMGVLLHNLCMKPDVTQIVAIDVDSHIIGLNKAMAEGEFGKPWYGAEKISWVIGDAREIDRGFLSRGAKMRGLPTCLLVDIWPMLGSEQAYKDVCVIQNNIEAQEVGWWGQEFDFLSWAIDHGVGYQDVGLDEFDRWCIDTGMIIHERSGHYIRLCGLVAMNQSLR